MSEHFSDRTKMMLGDIGYEKLRRARVAIFGIGGVGGFATEALARAGIGALDLIDSDRVSVSNINRQIIATKSTVGEYKTEAARARIMDINPDCRVSCHNLFYTAETAEEVDLCSFDYIIDAIDSVGSKVELIARAKALGVPIISAMGAGNKLDPTRFRVADISKTAVCPLAKAVRVALRKRGINHLKVVYSEEPPYVHKTHGESIVPTSPKSENTPEAPQPNEQISTKTDSKSAEFGTRAAACGDIPPEKVSYDTRPAPGSISFVPSVMGLILAGEVIKDISGISEN